MIDIGLAALGVVDCRQTERGEPGIAGIARIRGGHRVAADREEIERAALEAIRHLLAAAADPDEIIAVAGALEDGGLLRFALAGERVLALLIESDQLCLAGLRDRE